MTGLYISIRYNNQLNENEINYIETMGKKKHSP